MADKLQAGSRFRVKDSDHTGIITWLDDKSFSVSWDDVSTVNNSPYAIYLLPNLELAMELASPMFSLEEINAADL